MTKPVDISIDQFPEQIKELRIQKDLTQKELADKLKVSQQTISAIENGRMDPSLKLVTAIAGVLGVAMLIGAAAAFLKGGNEK
jgi:putative transcriptional regulator